MKFKLKSKYIKLTILSAVATVAIYFHNERIDFLENQIASIEKNKNSELSIIKEQLELSKQKEYQPVFANITALEGLHKKDLEILEKEIIQILDDKRIFKTHNDTRQVDLKAKIENVFFEYNAVLMILQSELNNRKTENSIYTKHYHDGDITFSYSPLNTFLSFIHITLQDDLNSIEKAWIYSVLDSGLPFYNAQQSFEFYFEMDGNVDFNKATKEELLALQKFYVKK